jgi:hypothetical protein
MESTFGHLLNVRRTVVGVVDVSINNVDGRGESMVPVSRREPGVGSVRKDN